MARHSYRYRRFLPVALVVVIIIIAVIILASLLRVLLFPAKSDTDQQKVDTTQQALLNTNADRAVRLVVRGPIVADENFRSYRITVSPNARTIQTFQGYLETQLEQKTLTNNVRAYEEFVHALNIADMTKGTQFEGDKNDVRGICASGRVSEFSLLQNNAPVEMLWTSTCGGSPGSLRASADQLRTLFVGQIPDAATIIRNASL